MTIKFLRKLLFSGLLIFSLIVTSCPLSALANDNNVRIKVEDKVNNLIPNKHKGKINSGDLEKIEMAASYGLLETLVTMQGNPDCPWLQELKDGKFSIQSIVPIYDLEENLSQTMMVYNNGYMIVDTDSGEAIQYSFGAVDTEYLNENDRCYVDNFSHFSISGNKVKDGVYKGKDINSVKNGFKKKQIKASKKETNRWGILSDEKKEIIISGFRTGNNEGNMYGDYITDAQTWLKNFIKNQDPSAIGTVSYVKGYLLSVPEIIQSGSAYPEENDCAVISTLEIMGYYWALTAANRNTAYNAIINSSYYTSSGVNYDDNDQIFKVGAEAIGKATQSTSDDPEDFINNENYSYCESLLKNYGPFYISMYQEPYTNHTITAKGVVRYSGKYTSSYSENYDFLYINDHWSVTSGNTFISLTYSNDTWYSTAIKVN